MDAKMGNGATSRCRRQVSYARFQRRARADSGKPPAESENGASGTLKGTWSRNHGDIGEVCLPGDALCSRGGRAARRTRQYGVKYTYLIAGAPSEMGEKIPEALNLSTWPATIFIGRDGRMKGAWRPRPI